MVEKAVYEVLAGEPDASMTTFVLQVDGLPLGIKPEMSREEKMRIVTEFFSIEKQQALNEARAVGATIKDHPGSPTALLTASARAWRKLLQNFEAADGIRIIPNQAVSMIE